MASTLEEYKDLPYYIDIVKEDDKEEVLEFFIQHFLPDAPLLGYSQAQLTPELKTWVLEKVDEGNSFKAVSKQTGEIIGICHNILRNRSQANTQLNIKDEKLVLIVQFMNEVDRHYNVFRELPDVDNFLENKLICVHQKYRQLGIAQNLMKKVYSKMLESDFPVFHVVCSNAYSTRIMQKMGLHEVYRINYDDYKDKDGKQVFCPKSPHKSCVVFIKTLYELKVEKILK